ncbi:uncharacterized protein LOC123320892 [Coccinella septempunctata]|uniref:uncharacterized protein LOC123320892 n=1 Tax=Coccinella septempunctata TaxID=41139 RepID=UPI001D082AA6|nr:uncharacterized protein LOC123320892 [Coccinella septempunctata]
MSLQFDKLSDCMLLFLLEHLDSTSLYQLSQVSARFEELILKKSLWKKIDARDEPNDEKKIIYILDRVHSLTEMLLLRGRKVYPRVIEMIQSNTFEKLTILALENQVISEYNGVRLGDFPRSLVELSLKNSVFESSSEFFRRGFEAMENLKVLIIDGCINVSSSTIMSVSKYPNLEIFSCYKCPIENSVAYFSIAVSNGFKKIKVFDVRLSGLGNTFLRAFMRKSNVSVIYFRNKDTSYELDFINRATEAAKLNLPVPKVQFNTLPTTGNEENLITDFGTLEFSRTTANYEECKLPKSFLYTYPYPPCTCGFKERQEEHKVEIDEPKSSNTPIYTRADERKLVEIISEDHWLDDDSPEGKDNVSPSSEKGNGKENGDTEKGQFCDNARNRKQGTNCAPTSSASDSNSLLDAQDQNPSHACTEIIYRVFAKKKTTKDQSVGTDTSTNSRNHTKQNENSFREDQPSTSGLSVPLRKRKLSNVEGDRGKKAKRDRSSSSSDEDDGDNKSMAPGPCPSSSSRSPADKRDEHSDGNILYGLKGSVATSQIQSRNDDDRPSPRGESSRGNSHEASTFRDRRRGVREVQPAHTQVYPCACGNHSVIVVTADETEDGDGQSLNPPENHFHPQHCEQRINLNAHQSLRVINRNENANARPEIELVEINKDKSLKCGLKQLSFRGYDRVSNLTLRNIENLHLDLLDVTYTKCTKKGILDFLRINPNCRVLHKEFCVCKPRMDF